MKPNANQLNISESELLEYIDTSLSLLRARPAGFGITVSEYCDAKNVSPSTARRRLKALVKTGKLKSENMQINGYLTVVYSK